MLKEARCINEIYNKNDQSFLFAIKNDKNNFSSILLSNILLKKLLMKSIDEKIIKSFSVFNIVSCFNKE